MLKLAFVVMLAASQLSGPGGTLPQILHPDFKTTAPLKAGTTRRSEGVVQHGRVTRSIERCG